MVLGTRFCIALAVLSLAFAAGAATRTSASAAGPEQTGFERAARQHLPGTWKFQYVNPEPRFEITGTSTYLANGTARYKGDLAVQGQSVPLEFAATWRVSGNTMETVITESSMPQIVPVGTRSTDTILELTPTVFRYTDDEEGMTLTETRIEP